MFKGKKGKQFAAEIGKRTKTFVPGVPVPGGPPGPGGEKRPGPASVPSGPSRQDIQAIKVGTYKAYV